MRKWLYIRVILVLLNLMPIGSSSTESLKLDWATAMMIFMLGSLWIPLALTLLRVGLQRSHIKNLLAVSWTKPSWHESPFDLHQPVQFFHLASFILMALGISTFWAGTWPNPGVTFLALGGGLWVGTWMSVFTHRDKFQ